MGTGALELTCDWKTGGGIEEAELDGTAVAEVLLDTMPIEEVDVGTICDVVGVGCCACEMAACGRVVIDDGGGLIVEASLLAVASLAALARFLSSSL